MASYMCLLHHPYGATMGTIRIASSLLQVREREPMHQTTVQTALEPMVCMQRVQMVLSHQRQRLQRRVCSCTQDPHILNVMAIADHIFRASFLLFIFIFCRFKGAPEADRASKHTCCEPVPKRSISRGRAAILHRRVCAILHLPLSLI